MMGDKFSRTPRAIFSEAVYSRIHEGWKSCSAVHSRAKFIGPSVGAFADPMAAALEVFDVRVFLANLCRAG